MSWIRHSRSPRSWTCSMHRGAVYHLPVMVFCLLSSAPLHGQATLMLADTGAFYDLTPYLSFLEDKAGTWSIREVTSAAFADRFVSGSTQAFPSGYSDASYWARFTVIDTSDPDRLWLLEVDSNSLDSIAYYLPLSEGGFEVRETGDAYPFDQRDVRHRNFVFTIPYRGDQPQTYFIRFNSQGPVDLPLRIWYAEAFLQKDQVTQFMLGGFFGVLVVMALYNLLLFLSIRDSSYLYYVLYILTLILYQVSVERVGFEHIWPNQIWWQGRANSSLGPFCAIWGIQFTRSFLHTRDFTPRYDRLLRGFIVLCVSMILFNLFIGGRVANRVVVYTMIVLVSVVLGAGVQCLMQGNRVARYYLLAWAFLLGGVLISLSGLISILPIQWSGYAIQVGSVMEVSLLSLGLGYRYTLLNTARERMRLRIATDLHDDIGGGLTEISLYSELVGRQSQGQVADWAGHIGEVARSLAGKMQDIVWAIQPTDETWEALEMRMKDYVTGLVTPANIRFRMEGLLEAAPPSLAMDVRRNVMLMFKEIVHNAVKHAGCSQIDVRWQLTRKRLWMEVSDDGEGFDLERVSAGNGLKNLHHRAAEIQAHLSIETAPGRSTIVTFEVPLDVLG